MLALVVAELTVIEYTWEAVEPIASCTCTPNWNVPKVDGVPETMPVFASRLSPVGRLPLKIDQE